MNSTYAIHSMITNLYTNGILNIQEVTICFAAKEIYLIIHFV